MLKRSFKECSADGAGRFFTHSARVLAAVFLCFLLSSCGGGSADGSPDEKARAAADYFARSFSLFIPDGYKVGVEGYSGGEKGGFLRGRFVFSPPEGGEAEIPPVPFLLTPDGNRLVLGAVGPLGRGDLDDSGIAGFGTVPASAAGAPVLLVSGDGRVIAAERVMDTRVDYGKGNMDKISLEGAPVLGDEDAKVVIVEYSDFQCPFCRAAARALRDLLGEYKGKVKLVYKQLPLSFHDWAYQASEASLCFHKLGGNEAFRRFHDEVFASQEAITAENHRKRFSLIAEGAGLDPRDVFLCADSGGARELIERDLKEAAALGVDGTPTLFVDGIPVSNDFDLLRRALELRVSPEG